MEMTKYDYVNARKKDLECFLLVVSDKQKDKLIGRVNSEQEWDRLFKLFCEGKNVSW